MPPLPFADNIRLPIATESHVKGLVFFILIAVLPLQARYTGEDFVSECRDDMPQMRAHCNGMVQAYLQMIEDHSICYRLPDTVTLDGLRRDVVAYVERHPMASDSRISVLLVQSIITAYPCDGTWRHEHGGVTAGHNRIPRPQP